MAFLEWQVSVGALVTAEACESMRGTLLLRSNVHFQAFFALKTCASFIASARKDSTFAA
ncbi:MAG: hypothetical protein LCH39_07040 [Proteobacteria bacterium]|nr:hypothetical protein [Pseudomonadota bacterium]